MTEMFDSLRDSIFGDLEVVFAKTGHRNAMTVPHCRVQDDFINVHSDPITSIGGW